MSMVISAFWKADFAVKNQKHYAARNRTAIHNKFDKQNGCEI